MILLGFKEQLKFYRKSSGLTQKSLADACGLSTGTIQQYELGKRIPTAENLHKISEILNCGYTFLKNGDINLYQFKDCSNHKDTSELEAAKYVAEAMQKMDVLFNGVSYRKQKQLNAAFEKLNEDGQKVAVERVEELAEIPKYKKESPKSDNTPSDE